MQETTSVIESQGGPRQLHLHRICLDVLDGPDAGVRLRSDRDVVRIGAHADMELQLTDPTVSRRHAEIVRTPDGVLLRDLNSTNGTWVGPVSVKEVYLGPSQRLRVGKTHVQFTAEDEVLDIVPSDASEFHGMVGHSVAIREVFTVLDRAAPTTLSVLVTGETGTGKELVSQAVHQHSQRASGPMVVFDCGAVPANLVEAELFGHERGAFTGAVAPRPGVFEQAHGGTLFIDELGELPLELQPKLLRALESREVRRVGSNRVRKVDVRVVAATNRDLLQEVKEGRFRQDLYYRLAVVHVELPPLRERKEDLPLLVEHLLASAPFTHSVRGASPEVLQVLQEYHWPGNVRELRNVLLRAIPFSDGDVIALDALPDSLSGEPAPTPGAPAPQRAVRGDMPFREAKDQLIEAFEREYLEDLLLRCENNISKAARSAGMDRKTLTRMLKRHDIK